MSDNSNNTTKQQKEAITLLSIGTFLEYFDLTLYVHMAILLNDLFFPPQSDPVLTKLIVAFTFCSSYVFRPIGGFIIGYIGDRIGRKRTIIITTSIMAGCCLTMANVGTYAEIGVTATIVMIMCRILQGFSSMGEIIGAQLYLVETLKQPKKYYYGGILNVQPEIGGFFALIVASFALSFAFNWRLAFWVGTVIAIVGLAARTRLRETPEYVDFKRRLKIRISMVTKKDLIQNFPPIYKEKTDIKAILSYFLIRFIGPACFYITYVYMANIMRDNLGFSTEQVIQQNTKISILTIIGMFLIAHLVKKYHPFRVAKAYMIPWSIILLFIPYLMDNIQGIFMLSFLQFIMFIPCLGGVMEMVYFRYIPVVNRFTILATTFGVAAALAYVIPPFGLIPLTAYFGSYGLWFILFPMVAIYFYGMNYIEKLEKKNGRYENYPDEVSSDQLDLESLEKNVIDYNFKNPEEYKSYNTQCEYAQKLLSKLLIINQQVKTKVNIKLVEKAIIFAKKWHDGQYRKTGEPYYSHPLAVADIVAEFQPKTDVVVAAILHDVLEDSYCPLVLIANEFNERIARIVYRLTRVVCDENGNKIKLTIEELINSLNKVGDKEALLIKEVDRLHNLSTIEGLSKEKQGDAANETLDNIITNVAYTVDDLNINNKLRLENDLLRNCQNILKKDQPEISSNT